MYEIVPEARQQTAVRFFRDQAFATPSWMLDRDILARVEHAGAVDRISGRQAAVLNTLLAFDRLQRLIESEAALGTAAYTLGELMDDLREAVWTEVRSGRATDVLRRNLQRAHLERLAYLMTELETLRRQLAAAAPSDRATRLHYRDAVARIDKILDPKE